MILPLKLVFSGEAVESNLVKLETSRSGILSQSVSIVCLSNLTHLSLLHNGLASFGAMERGLIGVTLGHRADQVLLRLVTTARVNTLLQSVKPIVVAFTSCSHEK